MVDAMRRSMRPIQHSGRSGLIRRGLNEKYYIETINKEKIFTPSP